MAQRPTIEVSSRVYGLRVGEAIALALASLGLDAELCVRVFAACIFIRVEAGDAVSWHRFKVVQD